MANHEHQKQRNQIHRRDFLGRLVRHGTVAAGVSTLVGGLEAATPGAGAELQTRPRATADTCIFIWLAGGMCHVDTFDPKRKGDGAEIAGSYYNAIKSSVSDIAVCEHLPRMAERMERLAILRTLHHQFPNHTQAVNYVHTGRLPSGTFRASAPAPETGSRVSASCDSRVAA